MKYETVYVGNVGETEVGYPPATVYRVYDENLASSLYVAYFPPSDFTLVPTNVSMVQFNVEGYLKSQGLSPYAIINTLRTSVGRLRFNLQGAGFMLYIITLPKELIPKNIKVEGAGEESEWRFADNTLLLAIQHASPVAVIIEFETIASVILGFVSSLIIISLITALVKPLFKKVAGRW